MIFPNKKMYGKLSKPSCFSSISVHLILFVVNLNKERYKKKKTNKRIL